MKSNYQFIPEEEKRRIIEMRTNGEKYIVIAEVFNRPIGTISTVWNKHKKQTSQSEFFNADKYFESLVTV
jgi:hypothetical protein